jgi:uncharacterized protein YecE (DUF72 family)
MTAGSSRQRIRIGTAGWSLYKPPAGRFPDKGSHLERYAAIFDAVEINSSFYRPHKPETYARWAASVPLDFRFAVKLPRVLTHEHRLIDCENLLSRFAGEVASLGEKRGPILIQLPPTLGFDAQVANSFFRLTRGLLGGTIACEPRHAGWFTPEADALLVDHRVARVAADPAPLTPGAESAGWTGLRYTRLHGSPRIYWSAYDMAEIECQAAVARATVAESWTIYDNTASGAALGNALGMLDLIRG